jgi:carboxyl-terminal processing protease
MVGGSIAMPSFRAGRLAWTVASLWLCSAALALADPPGTPVAPPAATAVSIDQAYRKGLELERDRQWSAAIDIYEKALAQEPGRTELRHRLRLCESHYRLNRRYQDHSFRNVLLRMPRDQALALYDELIERITTHYVESVGFDPLLRHGLDNLEVALRDPSFLQANSPDAAPERVLHLRRLYQERRARIGVRSTAEARAYVSQVCDEARQDLNINAASIVLEFAFGACEALDDYTTYLTPDKLDDLYSMIQGNFVGLGVELKLDPLGLKLMNVLKGGPAWDAGLLVGDRITVVDGVLLKGLGLDEAAGKLQGDEGSSVSITVLSANGAARDLRLTRRPVEVQSVAKSKIVDPAIGVGYIQLIGFQKSSTDELQAAIVSLQRQGMRYLVLDLRGNPGGLLDVSVDIADRFLDQGVIVSTRGRASGQTNVYKAHADGGWRMPMAVLIDKDSASASEILAGALKDHGRALILGERSYGKGSVQSIFPLKSAPTGLKITTAKFYSPKDRSYNEQGVEPDVPVRIVAKPVDGEISAISTGDPDQDPVLHSAIEQARRRLQVAG